MGKEKDYHDHNIKIKCPRTAYVEIKIQVYQKDQQLASVYWVSKVKYYKMYVIFLLWKCSGITLGSMLPFLMGLGRPYVVLGIKSGLAVHKASFLSTVLSFQSHYPF